MQTRPLRILIGTPCGGGQATVQYMLSLLDTYQNVTKLNHLIFMRDNLRQAKAQGQELSEAQLKTLAELESQNLPALEIGLYTLANESLLSRGRNHIAAEAIRGGWDKLMFIDADAKWTFTQFLQVVGQPHDFVAGACPLKVLPISLNYLPFQADEHYYRDRIRSIDSLLKMREGHGKSLIPIAYVGTAFMCLSRKVLLAMAEASEEYMYPNPKTGHLHTHWNIFATKPMHKKFMSEDWSACELARSLGFEVLLNTDVVISHVGNWVYSPEQAEITHKTKFSEEVQ